MRRSFDRLDRNWDRARREVRDLNLDRRVDRAIDRADRSVNRVSRWGWYGTWNRPAWGLGSLATAAVINEAVVSAIAAGRPTIVVPEAGDNLDVNSIEVSADETVRFTAATGDRRFEATADCRDGVLNGREPAIAAQAQLLNAACQVAFGS